MTEFIRKRTANVKNDILSGLTVALALVPEAVAFAFVAGVDPLVGLYGAFMMGLITSLFGGRPGMISGATGAMAVVMVHLIQKGNQVGISLDTPIENLGLKWLFITLLIVGGIQITAPDSVDGWKPQAEPTKDPEVFERVTKLVNEELKNFFRPEFLNRIDEIVVFNHLTRIDIWEISALMIKFFLRASKISSIRGKP